MLTISKEGENLQPLLSSYANCFLEEELTLTWEDSIRGTSLPLFKHLLSDSEGVFLSYLRY